MKKLGRGLLGFRGGFLAGAALTLGVCIVAGDLFDIPQAEGAYAMSVVFAWMPMGGVVGGVIGAIWASSRF